MEPSKTKKSLPMTEEEKISLLSQIKNSESSSDWSYNCKIQILKCLAKNVAHKTTIRQAWTCDFKDCSFQNYHGNARRLAIKVDKSDVHKLIFHKLHACLMHYCVPDSSDKNFCHDFLKLKKKLPNGAYLFSKRKCQVQHCL